MFVPFAYPPETAFDVLFLAVLILALLVLIMVAATLLYRVRIAFQDWLRAARTKRYAAAAEALAAGDSDVAAFLRQVPARDRRLVEGMLLHLAGKSTGEVPPLLQRAFVGLGSVPRAVRQTRSLFWFNRAAAATNLGLMSHRDRAVLQALRALLHDREPEVQMAAARALVKLEAFDTMPDIVVTLNRVETYSVLRMADIVMEAGHASVPALMDFLRNPAPSRSHSVALEQLGALRAVEAEGLIRASLASDSMEVRAAACRALGRIQSHEAVTTLTAALKDSAWQVRGQAARALGEIGDPAAVEWLLPLLHEPHWWTVYNTARSLAQLGAIAQLKETLAAASDPNGTLPSILREVLSRAEWEA